MNKLKIGDSYWRVSDQVRYQVTYEDKLCFYLCYFRGSSSKVTAVSKDINRTFDDFAATAEEALRRLIARQKIQTAMNEKFLKEGMKHENN